jgi:cysteine synthase A
VEVTGGNANICLAFITAFKEYKLKLAIPTYMNMERRLMLKDFSTELILQDAAKGMKGLLDKATEILNKMPDLYIHE